MAAKPEVDFTGSKLLSTRSSACGHSRRVEYAGTTTSGAWFIRRRQSQYRDGLMIAFCKGYADTLASEDPVLAVRDVLGQAR